MQNIELEFLSLVNYRNYESLELAFTDSLQVITGPNGAGKTTILDAIFYICNGKSYFTHLDRHIYRQQTDFFRLVARLKKEEHLFHCKLTSQLAMKKKYLLNEKKIDSMAELVGQFPAFMIAPRDILILMDSSIERRKVMDRTISLSDRVYLNHLLNYNRSLKQRNAFLKDAQKKGIRDTVLIDSLNESMVEPTAYITKQRKIYLESISLDVSQYYKQLSNDSEVVSLEYKTNIADKDLLTLLNENLRKDMAYGKTSLGLHKDDISIFINGNPIKKYASQGQLKSAVVALKLAQIEWIKEKTNKKPILLLDDIFDKLDKTRVKRLLELSKTELASQIFITDTDKERVVTELKELEVDYSTYNIEEGKLIN